MKKNITLLLVILLGTIHLFGQDQTEIDSLLHLVNSNVHDTSKVEVYIKLVNRYSFTDSAKVAEYANQAIQLAERIDYPKGISRVYHELGWHQLDLGAPLDEVISTFELGLQFAKQAKYDEGVSAALTGLGVTYKEMANYDKAIDLYKEALAIDEKCGNKTGIAVSYSNIAEIHTYKGNLDSALIYYTKALEIDKTLDDQEVIGNDYSAIGHVYYSLANYPKALEYHLKALKFYQKANSERYIGRLYTNIGNIYTEQRQFKEGLNYYRKSLEILERINDVRVLATIYNNMGLVYSNLNEYGQANDYLFKALEQYKALDFQLGVAASLANIGRNYFAEKKHAEAIIYLKKALVISQEIEFTEQAVEVMSILGEVYLAQGQYVQAKSLFKKSIQQAKDINAPSSIVTTQELLSDTEMALGNYAAALEAYKVYHLLYDSLLGVEKAEQLADLEVRYETEKKEREIKSLEQQTEIQNLELEQSQLQMTIIGIVAILLFLGGIVIYLFNRQKQLMLEQKAQNIEQNLLRVQMNPHFIFNAMTSIQDYMMQGDAEQAAFYLTKFSKLIRQVLDGSRSEFISLDQEVKMLEYYLSLQNLRREHPFTFDIQLDEEIVEEEIAIPPMFAQPFVENAIEHGIASIKEGAHIDISFSLKQDYLVLKVTDNGKGIEELATVKREGHTSHAVKITEERINLYKQMNKKKIAFNIQRLSPGTQVIFNLPFQYV